MAKGVSKRLWTLALCAVLIFSFLPAGAIARPEAEAKMASPNVFVLEQPVRQVLAPPLSRKDPLTFVVLGLFLPPRHARLVLSLARRIPALSPKPLLYSFGKLQLEGG